MAKKRSSAVSQADALYREIRHALRDQSKGSAKLNALRSECLKVPLTEKEWKRRLVDTRKIRQEDR